MTVIDSAGKPNINEPGFVYLMTNGKRYKIGRTRNVESRRRQIWMQAGIEIEVMACKQVDDHRSFEIALHRRFAHKRVTGEWFNLSDTDVQEVLRELETPNEQ